MQYTNGTKATWRYWAWKRLRERLTVHPSFATVLFLSGPSPEDLTAAIKNGFKISNIVAIDTDLKAVQAARKAGCIAIQGDIHDVVSVWDDGVIHGCIEDYCCGLTEEQFQRSRNLFAAIHGPVVFNFQRGRECDVMSKMLRQEAESLGRSKHRGELFSAWYCTDQLFSCTLKFNGLDPDNINDVNTFINGFDSMQELLLHLC